MWKGSFCVNISRNNKKKHLPSLSGNLTDGGKIHWKNNLKGVPIGSIVLAADAEYSTPISGLGCVNGSKFMLQTAIFSCMNTVVH